MPISKAAQQKKPLLWITRPSDSARILSNHLETLGFDTINAPLLTIHANEVTIETAGFQAIIFTSRNAVEAYSKNKGNVCLPAYVVGEATALQAKNAGFKEIHVAKNNGLSLCDLIRKTIDPRSAPLYYATGDVVAQDMATLLAIDNYKIQLQVLYRAIPNVHLCASLYKKITCNRISGIILMSPRTANIFLRTMNAYALDNHATSMIVFALSSAIAKKLPRKYTVRVAEKPTQQYLLQEIRKAFV